MKSWGFLPVGIAVFAVAALGFAVACDDDDEDENDGDDSAGGECLDYEDTNCLNYCRCLRNQCLETGSEDACNDDMCACADLHGCLIEDVVTEYDCQAVD